VAAFAERLWLLRQEAGAPSYEDMSLRLGAAASKSSLAAAAQGRTLPTWETTWEFVRVLAVDRLGRDAGETEKEWRSHWAQAAPAPAVAASISDDKPRPRFGLTSCAAALAVLLVATVVFDWRRGRDASPAVAAVRDDSQFEGDITYPDGTAVPVGTTFTKVWRIRNTGDMVWANRFLARINTEPCTAPEAVPIPQTAPGQTVDIAVEVHTPDQPARCKIYWKMADEQGRMMFPLKRPVFLDVRVGP
jgi:hypothetical protein